ncbi:amidohydrolase family protein [Microbacterium sp. ASV81]|uniref:Amidohydrolase family protein n=1 Tax=Microbacterium capsulatum TaxID=3041921 RepID=A0ABU0XHS8_9MICO|nr:amidohydrolase family protein [Microbacterium sp. ASV81]MDQ4214697.1 amidohydrolase family protein [Microbacterium sp. ASV81]
MSLLIKGGVVVTAEDGAVPTTSDVLIEGNRIAAIGTDLDAEGAEILDATGALVMPGLIDTHTHSWQFGIRGALVRGHGFLDYVKKFELYRHRFTPEDTYDAVRGCSLAQLDLGITGVLDFAHGANDTPAHVRAAFDAHRSTGQRTLFAVGSTSDVEEAADPERFEAARQERLDTVTELAQLVASETDPLVTVALGLLTPAPGREQRVLSEIDFGRSLGLQLTFHQNRPGEIALLAENDRLGPDLIVVHSNTANSDEVDMLVASRTALSATPESEVGAGWSPHIMRRALRRGIPVGIGIDTPSTDPVNLWQQIRVLMLLMKALDAEEARRLGRYPVDSTLERSTLEYEGALRVATRGGAYSLAGKDARLGILEPGALADVIVVRPDDPDIALADPAPYLVQYGSGSQVEAVVVDGVVRKRDFALVDVDAEELKRKNSAVRRRVVDGERNDS